MTTQKAAGVHHFLLAACIPAPAALCLHAAAAPPICPLLPLPRAVGRLPINWRRETEWMGMDAPLAL